MAGASRRRRFEITFSRHPIASIYLGDDFSFCVYVMVSQSEFYERITQSRTSERRRELPV